MVSKTPKNDPVVDPNLPVLATKSFDLAASLPKLSIDPDLLSEVTDDDLEGYTAPRDVLPIVSIRQKDLKGKDGKLTVATAGGFRMYDSLAKSMETEITDVTDDLIVTILADQNARTYWAAVGDAKPSCRSIDGLNGAGSPGGRCTDPDSGLPICPKAMWQTLPDGTQERPQCSSEINLLVWDYGLGACYVIRLGRSGIKPYTQFKKYIARGEGGKPLPLHFLKVRVSTKYETEPQPHFVPCFIPEGSITKPLLEQFRSIRTDLSKLKKTAEVTTQDEEHPKAQDAPASELPDGVEPVGPYNDNKNDALPF